MGFREGQAFDLMIQLVSWETLWIRCMWQSCKHYLCLLLYLIQIQEASFQIGDSLVMIQSIDVSLKNRVDDLHGPVWISKSSLNRRDSQGRFGL